MSTDTRLRAALTELAAHVDRSENPWDEHERRMAARTRTRRGWTIAAAAASVLLVVAVVTPLLMTRDASSPVADQPVPVPDARMGLARVVDYINGGYRTLWMSVNRGKERPTDEVCQRETQHASRGGEVIQREDVVCQPVPVPDDGPARVHPMPKGICDSGDPGVITDCAMVTGVVVVATDPDVTKLQVKADGGRSVTAREVGRTGRVALFMADFLHSPGEPLPDQIDRQRFIYTAHGSDGQVVDEVTLRGDGQ